ncbi:hypothetical protein MTO96_039576 [Rhipicephalus appendiculatus]
MNEKATQDEIDEVSTDVWQRGRASRLYHNCLSPQPSNIETDLVALKETMNNLPLTWPMEESQSTDAHPLGVMVEMALKWDINFVFGLEASRTNAMGKVLVFRRVYSRAAWVDRVEKSALEYSFLAAKLHKTGSGQKWFIMAKIDYETPSFNADTWLQHLKLHSEDSGSEWSSHDLVLLEDADILADVEGLFKKHTDAELLIGIAWMFLQSHLWAIVGKPELMFHDNAEEKKSGLASTQRALLYERFPSMNSSGFFASWLQASVVYQKLHGHKRYLDVYKKRRTLLYEAYSYSYLDNDVSAATVALEPPMFYEGAPFMMNYGGAGVHIARQMAKSFDPRGVNVDDRGETVSWWGKQHSGEYSSRVTCHLGEGAPVTMSVFPTIPAIEASFSAYKTVLSKLRALLGFVADLRIPGLEKYGDDQVFFMTYCYTLCSRKDDQRAEHECNVPLRHSRKFARVFRCPEGSPMSAEEKCTFFS